MLDFRLLSLEKDGLTRRFKQEVNLSYIKQWGIYPFQKPVQVMGTIKELDYGLFELTYQVNYASVLPCARCLTSVVREFSLSFTYRLGEGAQNPLTHWLESDLQLGRLHLTDLVGGDLQNGLKDQTLCVEDCKGLCPRCGQDKNSSHCDCEQEKVLDPRFDVLRELLGK